MAILSSLESACMATNTPEKSAFTARFAAPMRFRNASDEGLSDDLCDPTMKRGTGSPLRAKLRPAAVYPIVSVPIVKITPETPLETTSETFFAMTSQCEGSRFSL